MEPVSQIVNTIPSPPGNKRRRWVKVIRIIGFTIVIIASIIIIGNELSWRFGESSEGNPSESGDPYASNDSCNVTGLELHGTLVTYISLANQDSEGFSMEDQTASEDLVYYMIFFFVNLL